MNTHYQLGQQRTLNHALEIYTAYTKKAEEEDSGKKYLLLKHEDNSYSVAEKVSGLTYLFQVIASCFGGSGPAYSAKETNKAVLAQDLNNLTASLKYLSLSPAAKYGFNLLSMRITADPDHSNSTHEVNFTVNTTSQKPLIDVEALRTRAENFIKNEHEHESLSTIQLLLLQLPMTNLTGRLTQTELSSYHLLTLTINEYENAK